MTQPLPLREQLKALEHLQELDLKIDVLKKKKAALPAALKAADDSFRQIRMACEAKKNAIAEMEKVQRQTEAAMDLNKDRLTRANSKLEGVQNGQEFQAANKEIDQLKKLNGTLEEQIKKSKTDQETEKQNLAKLTADLEKAQQTLASQTAANEQQAGQLDKEIGALMGERTQYVQQVEARIVSTYDRVRGARAGLGIVPAVGGRCSGCNMMVPPQLFNEVQRGTQVHACPSCHRILFVPAQPTAAAPTTAK